VSYIKIFKTFFLGFVFCLLILLLLTILFLVNQHRDPLSALDFGKKEAWLVKQDSTLMQHQSERRYYQDVTLCCDRLDSIKFTVSFPYEFSEKKLPVILILGGLEIGKESLKYIPFHGKNILIAYQYPYSPRYWYDGVPVNQIPLIRKAVLSVPAQVVLAIKWIRQQIWCDPDKFSILGYSFGAMFVPACCHLAQERKIDYGPVILAYGGADLFTLLHSNLKFLNPLMRFLVSGLATLGIYPVEPALHLPHLKGKFLLINSRNDEKIPVECWQKFQELTPETKSIVLLDEGHMNPAKKELTATVINISYLWLLKLEVVNPFNVMDKLIGLK
jgi:hypothetical protein